MNAALVQVNAYRKNQFYTADRGTLLLMLFNGAINFLRQAKEHLINGEMAEKGTYIAKVHAIISELVSTLDFNAGEEIARKLEGLYYFALDRLMAAHLGNDIKPMDEVLSILETLREAWEGAVATARREGLA
ncbi:MAG: flagellar export chaperone FliS [Deltaproteobacteria bacterium]|nr:flagellar export chaperone FliS [Deltaproteobacteria bacterium]